MNFCIIFKRSIGETKRNCKLDSFKQAKVSEKNPPTSGAIKMNFNGACKRSRPVCSQSINLDARKID
uniref:Uncharacterized protein n=1 Tax=Nelumbo nucifera TaxID=4432 RepID=A0A822YQJ0_NELNU|nr:TPA_asm: hypothetical protein HUJ06_005492 [Nelumbo nucifera]